MMRTKKQSQPYLRLAFSRGDSSGYRSGRSSERETPETDSRASTRSAGTFPDFRHFWTAWYRTPSLPATDLSPPAPEIARETGFSMHSNVQPIIAFRQQPIRVRSPDTMQPMVEAAKYTAREEFAEWLNGHVQRLGAPVRGRPKWLQRLLEDEAGLKVSYETCRKWLAGLDIPDRANEALLHKALGVQVQAEETDQEFEMLRKIWRSLPQKSRSHLIDTAMLAQSAAKAGNAEQPAAEQKKRRRSG